MPHFFEKTDTQIQQDVINELKWDPRLSAERISVTANNGVVTLRGSVPHYFEKSTAEAAAQRVGGVRAVADEIDVNLMGSYERSDEDIARAAINVFEWNYLVPDDVKVAVEDGWITLTGEVDWDYQRSAAENSVSQLMGVCGVVNKISLKSNVQSSDVKTRIEEALKRTAESEGQKISVTVEGNAVTLTGDVQSLAEIEDARMAAWNAPGVMKVENKLRLKH